MTRERRLPGERHTPEEAEAVRALVEAQRAYDEALRAWQRDHPDGPRADGERENGDPRLRKAAQDLTLAGRQLRHVRAQRGPHGGPD